MNALSIVEVLKELNEVIDKWSSYSFEDENVRYDLELRLKKWAQDLGQNVREMQTVFFGFLSRS